MNNRTTQFPCPSCGYAYTTWNNTTRSHNGKETRRKRVCMSDKCRANFVTYEITAGDYAMLQAMRKFLLGLKTTNDNPHLGSNVF